MGNIFWLASYPKSGNTWMRVLLANYLSERDEPVSINDLGGGPIASAREAFDEYIGIEASDLLPSEIERYRPFVYEQISAETDTPIFLKIHDAFTHTKQGTPLISATATRGVIYLLRNPLDVAVSFAHHNGCSIKHIVQMMAEPSYSLAPRSGRIRNQLSQKLLTWSQHVCSWVDESKLPVLVIRYEDMKTDPIATFSQVIQFCGFDADAERIARAVDFSSFARLKAQEATEGFGEKSANSIAFFRKGTVGNWREQVKQALADQLVADHAIVMERFGYLTADGKVL